MFDGFRATASAYASKSVVDIEPRTSISIVLSGSIATCAEKLGWSLALALGHLHN